MKITPTLHPLMELRLEIEQLRQSYQKQRVTVEQLQHMGAMLWKIMALDSIPQHLEIISDHPFIHDIPWETLHHPTDGFIALSENFHLTRHFQQNSIKNSNITSDYSAPFKILLFTAQVPTSASHRPLLLELEQFALRRALAPLLAAGEVQLYAPNDGRFNTLCHLLQHSWHLVILSGHGFSQQGQTGVWFEGENSEACLLSRAQITQAFESAKVHCVMITACQSLSLAMRLSQLGIPHVIGMWETLLDRAACRLIETFCTTLVSGNTIETALQRGRIAMTQLLEHHETWGEHHKYPDVGQWCLPVLFSRTVSQPLVKNQNLFNTVSLKNVQVPELFIGRRQTLRELSEQLGAGDANFLWLWGRAGVGKTALAKQLAWHFIELGLPWMIHSTDKSISLSQTLQQYFDSKPKNVLDNLHQLTQQPCLLWIDGKKCDENTLNQLEILARWRSPKLKIIVSTRQINPVLPNFQTFQVQPINYSDFCRYILAQGLPYQSIQLRLIYQATRGNFHALRLLENLPFPADTAQFWQNMAILQRYLRSVTQ